MKKTSLLLPCLALLLGAATLLVPASPAEAEQALLTKDGTLYEVVDTTFGVVVPGAPAFAASTPVLALRATAADGTVTLDVVGGAGGTVDGAHAKFWELEYEPDTGTVFVVYTRSVGLMTNVQVAILRSGAWTVRPIAPSRGLYLSLNPRAVVTRQRVTYPSGAGKPVVKTRSILSIVWWEESGPTQARYAPVFVEDGVLKIDDIQGYYLNELAGRTGITDGRGIPLSAYQYPAVQADPTSNGGVLVSFANLVDRSQSALKIGFADDLVSLVAHAPEGENATAWAQARAHVPVGREISHGSIQMAVETVSDVSTFISLTGTSTFYWQEGAALKFIGSNAKAGDLPRTLVLRKDFTLDRAIRVLGDMAVRQ